MTIRVSTAASRRLMPSSAFLPRFLPSKPKGLVTTPTVRAPQSRATWAMTGAAPVPVPPPMPAVTKTMSAPEIASAICWMLSSAARRPISGLAPAPRPLVRAPPSPILWGARLASSAWRSVLAATNSTPSRLPLIMVLTALPPPPPTPMTRILAWLTSSKSMRAM
jgi:hypothetical protein